MKQLIDNIKAIHYVKLSDITSLDINLVGLAILDAPLHLLDIGHGSTASITRAPTDSGIRYTTSVNIVMKSQLLIKDQFLLVLSLTDGDQLLVGDTDLPISYSEAHLLAGKDISIEHVGHRYPPTVALATGSGSGSGGGGL